MRPASVAQRAMAVSLVLILISPSFQAIAPAIDWLEEHHTELLVGTVVVIAGVAFTVVVADSGGGALALAPLVLFAEASR